MHRNLQGQQSEPTFFSQDTRENSLNAELLYFTPEPVVPGELLNVLRQAK